MDFSPVALAVLAFLAVVLALEGLYNLWLSHRGEEVLRVKHRLAQQAHDVTPEQASIERAAPRESLPWFAAILQEIEPGRRLTHWVQAAGVSTTPGELIVISIGLAIVGLLAPGLFGAPMLLGAALAVVLFALPWLRTAYLRRRRIERFELQFPEALDLMGRAMRAGHSFSTAVQMVGDEVPAPLGTDFRVLFDELNYGVALPDALTRLCDRVPLPDVSYFAVAVLIQRDAGGNLAELLDKIAGIVRARLKLMGDVRTLSAEGRLSAWILTLLPFVVAFAIGLVNPEFIKVLWTDKAGPQLIAAALLMMVLGVWWMRKIIRIHV
ncbi:MAG TPA: type II secretion system F family protein [Albitalea sp.]|nr:type II secretion system F family protein [Albitalea sp.]